MSNVLKRTVVKPYPFIMECVPPAEIVAGTLSAALLAQVQEQEAQQSDIIYAAQKEAAQIVAEAHQQAQAIREKAQQECEAARQAAEKSGYAAGLAAGQEEGRRQAEAECQAKIASAAAVASSLLVAAEQERREILRIAERQIIQLALAVASKVLQRELTENPEAILPIVKAALAPVVDQELVTVRVHPENFASVAQARQELAKLLKHSDALRLVADAAVERGGCVVDTPNGTVDARLDTQLAALRQTLEAMVP